MIRNILLFIFLTAFCGLPGCYFSKPIPTEAGLAIEDATEFELFSLDPFPEKLAQTEQKTFDAGAYLAAPSLKTRILGKNSLPNLKPVLQIIMAERMPVLILVTASKWFTTAARTNSSSVSNVFKFSGTLMEKNPADF